MKLLLILQFCHNEAFEIGSIQNFHEIVTNGLWWNHPSTNITTMTIFLNQIWLNKSWSVDYTSKSPSYCSIITRRVVSSLGSNQAQVQIRFMWEDRARIRNTPSQLLRIFNFGALSRKFRESSYVGKLVRSDTKRIELSWLDSSNFENVSYQFQDQHLLLTYPMLPFRSRFWLLKDK